MTHSLQLRPFKTSRSFTLGVNLPWLSYGCDFGGNAWFPDGGVGRPGARPRASEVWARLADAGLATVRWFLFCDGRAGIRFDASRRPTGLDDHVFRDLDAALDLAAAHRLSVIFVLFDYLWCHRRAVVNGVSLGGHRRTIARPDDRARLLEHVLAPVFARYGRETGIAAWDLFNEPEHVTLGYGGSLSRWPVLPGRMRGFLAASAALAHAGARQPVTVGLASARGLPLVEGCRLDLYQVHWYDRVGRKSRIEQPPLASLDRPLLLGEFPSAGSARSVEDLVEAARAGGYCGALAWSAMAEDSYSDLAAVERALGRPSP